MELEDVAPSTFKLEDLIFSWPAVGLTKALSEKAVLRVDELNKNSKLSII